MQRVLVTGGAGYVGSHVTAQLVARGYQVTVLDNLSQGHIAAVVPGAHLVVGDLADRVLLDRCFEEGAFAGVFHLAARSLVGESMQRPFLYLRDNVQNGLNLIESMVTHGVGRLVFSSTCAIFGTPERDVIVESESTSPASPYGESKLTIERMLVWADRVHGLRSACLRYFNAAGAHPQLPIGEDHDPETHLIPIALDVALGLRAELAVFGNDYPTADGTAIRDYVHVCDLADAHVRAFQALERGSHAFNLGTGQGHSVREIVDAVERITGRKLTLRMAPRRPGDPPRLVAAAGLSRRVLGWEPRLSDLETIVATAWNWRRSHPAGYASRFEAAA